MTEIHNFLPKHGEAFEFEYDGKNEDIINKIINNYNEISLGLVSIWTYHHNTNRINCRQCVKDLALVAHDLSEALIELSEVGKK